MDLARGDTRLIINVCAANDLLRNQAAYVLATARHETGGTMKPVRETFATSDKQAISRLDAAWAKGQLKWVKSPYWRDGWFGRGYVQLTHRDNYDKAGRRIGIDLVSDPAKAMIPEVAAKILVKGMQEGWFTGKKLADYITLTKSDFRQARRIVNGMDRADDIALYAKQYDALLKAEGYGERPTVPTAPGTVVVIVPDAKPEPRNRLLAWLIDALSAFANLFSRKEK
jgi:hypothetical protein